MRRTLEQTDMKTPRMRTPPSDSETTFEQGFASSHERMRGDGKTGTVEVVGEGTEGGAVFLNGAVVYARYRGETATDALTSLLSCDAGRVRASSSTSEAVRMFRTYTRYISDEGLLTVEPLDGARVEPYEVEGVIVQGVENTAGGSWGNEGNVVTPGGWTRNSPGAEMPDSSRFPEGRRTVLASDAESLRRHVTETGATGYAVANGGVITFYDGEFADKKRLDFRRSVRTEVGAGSGWVVVDTSPDTDDATEDEHESNAVRGTGEEANGDGGLLSRIF